MKKLNLILLSMISFMAVSCIEPLEEPGGGDPADSNIWDPREPITGEVSQGDYQDDELIFQANQTYTLSGPFIMNEGTTLIIEEGVVINADQGDGAQTPFIGIAQDAEIYIQGTSTNPVLMTSGKSEKAPGDWGGLVVCGNAPTNKGATAISEVGDLSYGGDDVNDSSGSIEYLIVEYTGKSFNSTKEFNGVSLFGVGSGTTFQYVESYNGGDDGIEFFGGTVNASYLVSTGSGDDSIDFADGWAGTGEYWYINNGTKAGIEGSNNGDNGAAEPKTNATLRNISIVGGGTEGALFIKEGGGNWDVSNVYVRDFDLGIKIKSATDDPDSNANVDNGNITFNPIQFENVVLATDYAGSATFYTEGANDGAGSRGDVPVWAEWTRFSGNYEEPPVYLNGQIEANTSMRLYAGTDYILDGPLEVLEGGSLTIDAGVIIKADQGDNAQTPYIAVAQGGMIFINGESNNPVVMTSGKSNPEPADWGGLVVCGKAPTNKGSNAISEVGDLPYGGDVLDDNSGVIRYLRLEYTGKSFNSTKEFNGLSLFGVGSQTTVEYVQSYKGGDDGIEFFGGTVNGKYLVSIYSGDDSIDFADGWAGTGSYWYINYGTKAGIEGSNNGDNGAITPMTNATLENISIIGGGTEGALYIKEGGGMWNASNIYIEDFELGIKVKPSDEDGPAWDNLDNGNITFNPMWFVNVNQQSEYTGNNTDYLVVGENTGAGNGAGIPDWANGWTVGLE
jgi:hypothetical protein